MLRRLFPIVRGLAKAALIVAAGLALGALVLTVAACHVMAAPYRWTRDERGPRAAQYEALTALAVSLVALYQSRKGNDGGETDKAD